MIAISCWPAAVSAQEWHDLYGDGVRALRDRQGRRAVDLLKRAIDQRPRPGVNVPTYGTNFEPRYFPYLRLAEAYLLIDAPEDARQALETSARLGLEPAAERAVLEARVHTALEAKGPRPAPAPTHPLAAATPPSTPAPPDTPAVTVLQSPSSVRPEAPPTPVATPLASTAQRHEVASEPRPTPAARPSALDLTSHPPGAQVFLDDVPIGRTDPETGRLRVTGLPAGRHRIRLAAEKHEDLIREVDLVGPSLAMDAALSLLAGTPPPLLATSPTADPTARGGGHRRLVAVGVGLLLLVAFVGLWLKGFSGAPKIPPQAARSSPGEGGSGTDESLPQRFGEYQLIRRLGKGGMACVYEAERRGERFALKRPLSGFLDDPRFLERFVREAELGRTLHHPNIIRIFDRGQVGATPFFAMELVDGETLRARLDLEGRLLPPRAARIASQVAEALDYAHNKGVVHRDLKPSNIMIERSGGLKVMDYGIARAERLEGLTASGAFLGTPNYTAPETIESTSQPKSDLYALGVVLFEMLTGSLPFRGETPFAVLRNHCLTPPPVPSSLNLTVPKDLDRIVLRLLSKDPSDRPTAEELLNELADHRGQAR